MNEAMNESFNKWSKRMMLAAALLGVLSAALTVTAESSNNAKAWEARGRIMAAAEASLSRQRVTDKMLSGATSGTVTSEICVKGMRQAMEEKNAGAFDFYADLAARNGGTPRLAMPAVRPGIAGRR